MAAATTVSNHAKFMQATKKIDFANDVFKIILMDTTFAFDRDAHATLSDVTANQLSTGNGYTQDSKILAGVTVTEDDTNDKAAITWDDATFTASGGDIGPTGAHIVYDDTTTDKTVVFCTDFDADYTILDGSSLQIQTIYADIL